MLEARKKLTVAISKVKGLRYISKTGKKEILVAGEDVALQGFLLEESRKELDAKLAKPKEVQSQLVLKEDELVTLYDVQLETTAEMLLLRTKNANETTKPVELKSVATEREQPIKLAKVVCGSESGMSALPTAAYPALPAKRDESKNRAKRRYSKISVQRAGRKRWNRYVPRVRI